MIAGRARVSTSGWRRKVPVAEQGASSRIAAGASFGVHSSASAVTSIAESPVRLRLSRRRSSRSADWSSAVTSCPAAANCIVLPPGAAHRSSTVLALCGIRRAGSDAARSCTHQSPAPKSASSVTLLLASRTERGASSWPSFASANALAAASCLKLRSSAGRLAICRRAAMTESSPHILPQRYSTARGSCGGSMSGTGRRNKVPSTPWTSRRGPPSTRGKAVATIAWSGVSSPTFCAKASRSTARAFESSARLLRVALSIHASRSGNRRNTSPAIAAASAWSLGARPRAEPDAAASVMPRRSTASIICNAARRAPRPSTLGMEPRNPHVGAMKRPANIKPPGTSARRRPSRRRKPATIPRRPRARRPRLDPTRYGDWEKKGIAVDF